MLTWHCSDSKTLHDAPAVTGDRGVDQVAPQSAVAPACGSHPRPRGGLRPTTSAARIAASFRVSGMALPLLKPKLPLRPPTLKEGVISASCRSLRPDHLRHELVLGHASSRRRGCVEVKDRNSFYPSRWAGSFQDVAKPSANHRPANPAAAESVGTAHDRSAETHDHDRLGGIGYDN
jgi:hypothetical protein